MNCKDWEERIALHAEGDLPPQERAEAERHLAECAGCREFLAELKQSLATLRAAHAESVEASVYTALRARVFERIDYARRPVWWLGWIGALAATAAALIMLVLPRQLPPPKLVAAPPEVTIAPVAPAISLPPEPVPSRKRRAAPRRERQPPEPLVVKLITDDPNVVIYWITN